MRNILFAAALAFSSITAACAVSPDDTSDSADESATAGKFALWQSTDGWHFHLAAGNGAILLASESYTDRTGAINGILSVMNNGVDSTQYRILPAVGGYIVELIAVNDQTIAVSEVYSTNDNAKRAVTTCMRATTSYLDKREALSTGARVEVEASSGGGYHFNLVAQNGQIVMASEHYSTEAAAYNGAFAVQAGATFTVAANTAGGYYFNVTAANNEIVGTSQQYSTKEAAQTGATTAQSLIAGISIL